MSSSRQGVGGRGKGSFEVVEENGAAGNRTLPTAMSVRNLGQSPHVLGSQAILDGGRKFWSRPAISMCVLSIALRQGRSISMSNFLISASYVFL